MDSQKSFPEPHPLTAEAVLDYMQSGATLVDVRSTDAFLRAHVPGAVNIPAQHNTSNVVPQLMRFLHPGAAVIFVGDDVVETQEIAQMLHHTRRNPVVGWYDGTMDDWPAAEVEVQPFPTMDLRRFREILPEDDWTIVDVREPGEWRATGVIPKSKLMPLDQLHTHITEFSRCEKVAVICHSGPQAIIAASLLRSHGLDAVAVAPGGAPDLPASKREPYQ